MDPNRQRRAPRCCRRKRWRKKDDYQRRGRKSPSYVKPPQGPQTASSPLKPPQAPSNRYYQESKNIKKAKLSKQQNYQESSVCLYNYKLSFLLVAYIHRSSAGFYIRTTRLHNLLYSSSFIVFHSLLFHRLVAMHAIMSTCADQLAVSNANVDNLAPVPSTPSWVRGPNLGRGAFAQVYLATDVAGQIMAVKTAVTPAAAESLRHEEAVLSLLQGSPYVVPCLGHDVTHDDFYGEVYNLFLEYAPGGSLSDLIKRRGSRLPENLVRRLAREILRGLAFVHGQGYVHCDVKPQNILVFQTKSEKGTVTNVKLADFGLAKKVGEPPESSLHGTMLYMSPESMSGQCEPPMDVWAVGLVVIEMLTGKPAYHVT